MNREKLENLHTFMEQHTKKDVIVAFSGGVDSSLLLKLACEHAKKNNTTVYAYTIHTMLHPMKELELTERLAKEMGAKELGITTVIEGTNADDLKAYRPGIKALKELGVQSPLLLCGITKLEIRELAREYDIAVSDRPSAPCLATRFAYNTKLDATEMQKVEQMESQIRDMGFYNVRTRIQDRTVRIEVDESDIGALILKRRELVTDIKSLGYDYVTVDLEGFRSGSQDLHIVNK